MKTSLPRATLVVALALSLLAPALAAVDKAPPQVVEGAKTVSVEEAKAMLDVGVPFIDVRNRRFYARRHVPGAHHLDLKGGFTEEALSAIVAKDQPLVLYCSGVKCSRSSRASAKAVSWGFTKVHYFRGGIADWRVAGMPLESSE
jgi:rhodanese-related sulfurtransferase